MPTGIYKRTSTMRTGKYPHAKGKDSPSFKHGYGIARNRDKTYACWATMMRRCFNPNCDSYRWYGGRGITVCNRWKDFVNFLKDMGKKPKGLTLDRINTDGNYEPSNCRWANWKTQATTNRGCFKKRKID